MSPCSARDVHPVVAQRAEQLVAADLGAHEDDRLVGLLGAEHLDELVGLVALVSTGSWNCSTVSIVSVAALTLTTTGSYMYRSASLLIGAGIVAREERRLATGRGQREDLLDVLQEAEIEHLVGLVEHDEAAVVQYQRVAGDEIEDAPDGADHDVPAGTQLRLLGADRGAAENRHDIDLRVVHRKRAAPE